MNLFEIVKYGVSCREAAELYGMEVNRYGMALCPFHNDRHPSLYVADDHYYCFACGEHGDVIDFVGKLFQLSPYDAARKLMADFHLSPDKPPSAAALHAKRIRTEAQQLISGKARENMETVKRSSNNVIEFLQSEGYIRFRADSEASSKAIYEAYTRWCDDNAQKPMSANRVSSELAQNERLYNVEATNNVHVGGKRVRGFMGIEVVNPPPY